MSVDKSGKAGYNNKNSIYVFAETVCAQRHFAGHTDQHGKRVGALVGLASRITVAVRVGIAARWRKPAVEATREGRAAAVGMSPGYATQTTY